MSKKYIGKYTYSAKQKENPQKNGKKHRPWQWILLSVFLVLLALVVCAIIFVFAKLGRINRVDRNESRISPEDALTFDATEASDTVPNNSVPETVPHELTYVDYKGRLIGESKDIVNILLIGQDRREGEGRARSDAMILVSFNTTDNTITISSILRDTYVQIPGGYQDDRINVAYAFGGMGLLDETLEQNFGVYVDGNIEVDFSSFEQIIDILGGVDIELTQSEANYLNRELYGEYYAGVNHLGGEAALTYSRIRSLDSDFGRTSRQRNVLNALFESFKEIDLSTALELVDEILPMLTTDMSSMDIIGYVTDLLPMLSSAKVENIHIPGDENYYNASIRGMSVLVPDLEACHEQLREAIMKQG